jgi:hypothetical protein
MYWNTHNVNLGIYSTCEHSFKTYMAELFMLSAATVIQHNLRKYLTVTLIVQLVLTYIYTFYLCIAVTKCCNISDVEVQQS